MNEILEENVDIKEPENNISENSFVSDLDEGKACIDNAPSELILGKFKTTEELTKAYQELEKLQGFQSKELGQLRQNSALLENVQKLWEKETNLKNAEQDLRATAQKYETYFQDDAFKEIFKEAYLNFGNDFDVDRMVNLLENYVASRLYKYQQEQNAKRENEKAISSLNFSKNTSSEIQKPVKRLDEMTPQELDELLEKFI